MKISRLFAQFLLLLAGFAGVLRAQETPQPTLVFKGQRVTLTAAQLTSDGVGPTGPAKVCLAPSGMCFTPDADFGLTPEATIVQLDSNQQALLFTAVASASGSGRSKLIALLRVRNGALENLSPGVKISEQGAYEIWHEPGVSNATLLVTADYVWGAGETHFSPHRFKISTYALGCFVDSDCTSEPNLQSYFLRDEYVTRVKYNLDTVHAVDVLEQEKPEVFARLRRQK